MLSVKFDAPDLINRLIILDQLAESRKVVDSNEYVKALLYQHFKHSSQARNTSFAVPPLSNISLPLQPNIHISKRILVGDIPDFREQNNIITSLFHSIEKLLTTSYITLDMLTEELIH